MRASLLVGASVLAATASAAPARDRSELAPEGVTDTSASAQHEVEMQQGMERMDCGLLYFVHIPKTGGMSVIENLAQLHDQGWGFQRLYWGDDRDEQMRWVEDKDRWKTSDAWTWLQLKMGEDRPKMLMEAHNGAPPLAYMVDNELKDIACELKKKGCSVRVAAVLREPADRMLSSVRYQLTVAPGGDPFNTTLRVWPDPVAAADNISWVAEEQSRYLVAGHALNWPDNWHSVRPPKAEDLLTTRVEKTLEHAHIVDKTKNLDGFMSSIYSLLGVNPPSMHAARENVDSIRNATWEAQLSDVIHKATRTDRAIYKSWFPADGSKRAPAALDLC